jgi:hypothetical protein
VIYFHSRRYFSLSLFEESSKDSMIEGSPVKRGRGRPPKLKAVASDLSDKNDLNKEELLATTFSSEIESDLEPTKEVEKIVALSTIDENAIEEVNSADEVNTEMNWDSEQNIAFELDDENQNFDDNYEEEYIDENVPEVRDFSQNNVSLSFSWSLMNQLRQMSKMEGISVEDLLVELVAEGVAKRVFEDQNRPTPSHLMTRTGYVHSDGTQSAPQPHLSHHMMNNNRQQQNNLQNRNNRFSFQQRNPQHQQQNNNRNSVNNRNYQQNNNNNRQPNNNQNGFRNQYSNNNNNPQQQRFNSRPNYQNSQRFYDEQSSSTNSQQTGNQYRQQRDNNKR